MSLEYALPRSLLKQMVFGGGKNGGRACMYIAGTFCAEVILGTHREEWKNCEKCNFYNLVRREEGAELSVLAFDKYVNEKKKKTS